MKVRLIAVIIFIVLGAGALIGFIASSISTASKYNNFIDVARENAKKDIPYVAVQNYISAFNIKCKDEKVYLEYLKQSKKLGDNFYDTAIKKYNTLFPESSKAYEYLCDFYHSNEDYKKVITFANEAKEKGIATEKVRKLYIDSFYRFNYIANGCEEVHSFLGGKALVKKAGLYGFIDTSGSTVILPCYDSASDFLGESTAVKQNSECFMINEQGYKIKKPSTPVDEMSFVSNGRVLVSKGGKYGYADSELNVPKKLEFDQATNFKNGVAAVRKGEKWALISSEGKNITDYIFEDVIIDEFNTCINNGIIFAKTSGKYYMYNSEGKAVSKTAFDNAYPFAGEEPAAVCIGGKWGFADANGKIVIKPKYAQAKSFGCGLAAVCENGIWGYVNSKGEKRIEFEFSDCLPFYNGIAAVKKDDVWGYIKLLPYESD